MFYTKYYLSITAYIIYTRSTGIPILRNANVTTFRSYTFEMIRNYPSEGFQDRWLSLLTNAPVPLSRFDLSSSKFMRLARDRRRSTVSRVDLSPSRPWLRADCFSSRPIPLSSAPATNGTRDYAPALRHLGQLKLPRHFIAVRGIIVFAS